MNADDTTVEVATTMARLECPLVAAMQGRTLLGVVSTSRLIDLVLTSG